MDDSGALALTRDGERRYALGDRLEWLFVYGESSVRLSRAVDRSRQRLQV